MPVARCPLTVARCPISNVNALIDLTTLSQTPIVSRMSVVLLQYSFGQRTTDNGQRKKPLRKGAFPNIIFFLSRVAFPLTGISFTGRACFRLG